MTGLIIHQFEYEADNNYGVLVHDPQTGQTAAVDAGVSKTYLGALKAKGWELTQIWITHHHWDHVDGLSALKQATGAHVYGPSRSANPIKAIDTHVADGDVIKFANRDVGVIHTPGHSLDMLNYHLGDELVVFTGDTVFVLGCGRLLEGTPAQMWRSIQRLMGLPDETRMYCSHEYTLANAAFAVTIDPGNQALLQRVDEIKELRSNDLPTVPTTIGLEKQTNPFLRPGDAGIREQLDMMDATDEEVFAEIRAQKDRF